MKQVSSLFWVTLHKLFNLALLSSIMHMGDNISFFTELLQGLSELTLGYCEYLIHVTCYYCYLSSCYGLDLEGLFPTSVGKVVEP